MAWRRAAMCWVFLVGCSDERPRDVDTARTSDSPLARTQVAPVSDSNARPDTVIMLGTVERDMTGDGRSEVLRLTAVGKSIDSLDVTLVIESSGDTLFQTPLSPLTRTVGFDGGRRQLSAVEHRARLDQFSAGFFDDARFSPPDRFVERLRGSAPARVAEIPHVIAQDRQRQSVVDSLRAAGHPAREAERRVPSLSGMELDTVYAVDVWEEIQRVGVTVFRFSPGGDAVTAIAWSPRDQRFYRLLECC